MEVLQSIKTRMAECQLQLHEKKTKIVFCKKYKKRSDHKTVKFDFLGFSFQPRATAMKTGQMFLGYDCAISQSNKSKILEEIRHTQFQRWTNRSIEEIAEFFESKIIGWSNTTGSSESMRCIHCLDILTGDLLTGQDDGISDLIDPLLKRADGTTDSNVRIQSYLHIGGWDLLTRNFE